MRNERGAGRKPLIDELQLMQIADRVSSGESVSKIAVEYGVSRQALYKRLQAYSNNTPVVVDYWVDGELTTTIEVYPNTEEICVAEIGTRVSQHAFGFCKKPEWKEFSRFLEKIYLSDRGCLKRNMVQDMLCEEFRKNTFALEDVVKEHNNYSGLDIRSGDISRVPRFEFEKKDLLFSRTDTDGFQFKALSQDRRWFVKSQAVIGGVMMDDWAVELIATDVCNQLGIGCVQQERCLLVYSGKNFNAVFSQNFELDGYSFESFERLIERHGESTRDSEFIKLSSIQKLRWCAERLAEYGKLEYKDTLKYMLDLAVVDCIVGNVDRHTRNFGLFFNCNTCRYEIPLLFDNGMGLFEHDYYRDRYSNFDEAMRNVYISPYGEDPLDMLTILDEEFGLMEIYPQLANLVIHSDWMTENAQIYINKVLGLWQK